MTVFSFSTIRPAISDKIYRRISGNLFEHRYLALAVIELMDAPFGYITNGFILESKNSDGWIIALQTKAPVRHSADEHHLFLYGMNWNPENLAMVCERISASLPESLKGMHVRGTKKLVAEVVEHLRLNCEIHKDRLFYECHSVMPQTTVAGDIVIGFPVANDFDEIARMINDFRHEEWSDPTPKSLEQIMVEVEQAAGSDEIVVLKANDEIMCVCAMTRRNGEVEVNEIFTKTTKRGQGFGIALLAEVTRLALQDHSRCILMSDAQNLVSNHVFRKVGYNPIYEYIHLVVVALLEDNS